MNEPTFKYLETTHTTVCTRKVHNKIYIGTAKCHPHDYDFENKLTGQHYAYMRSMIKEMCEMRDQYKQQLKILRHLYNIYEQNPNIDLRSNECYYARRQIQVAEEKIIEMKQLIKEARDDLRDTIKEKDKLYDTLRANRQHSNS